MPAVNSKPIVDTPVLQRINAVASKLRQMCADFEEKEEVGVQEFLAQLLDPLRGLIMGVARVQASRT